MAVLPAGCDVQFHIICCALPFTYDRFTVELSWSEIGRLPFAGGSRSTDPPRDGGLSFRLSSLWHPQGRDYWWVLGHQRTLEEMANFVPDQPAEEKAAGRGSKLRRQLKRL